MRFLLVLTCLLLSATARAEDIPFRADSGLTKAEAQLSEGKYTEALETLALVLHRRPADADALAYTGYAWHRLGDNNKAGQFFDRALKYDPKHLGANKYKADMYLANGNVSRAHEQMQVLRMVCGETDCAELNALQGAINRSKTGEVEGEEAVSPPSGLPSSQ
jgi:tetratricopeptide (TPR) repeat protein